MQQNQILSSLRSLRSSATIRRVAYAEALQEQTGLGIAIQPVLKQSNSSFLSTGITDVAQEIKSQLADNNHVLLNSSTICYVEGSDAHDDFLYGVWEHAKRRCEDQSVVISSLAPTAKSEEDRSFRLGRALALFPGVEDATIAKSLLTATIALAPFSPQIALSLGLDKDGRIENAAFQLNHILSVDALNCNIFRAFFHSTTDKEKVYLSCKDTIQDYQLLQSDSIIAGEELKQYATSWKSEGLKQCGLDKNLIREILASISGIMLIGNNKKCSADYNEGCLLLGLNPNRFNVSTECLVLSLYNRLAGCLVSEINKIFAGLFATQFDDQSVSSALIRIVELDAVKYKAKIFGTTFSDDFSINAEMISDGLVVPRPPREISTVIATKHHHNASEEPLHIELEFESSSVLKFEPHHASLDFDVISNSSRVWFGFEIPRIEEEEEAFDNIIDDWRFHDYVFRSKAIDYTADFEHNEFFEQYSSSLNGVSLAQLSLWAKSSYGWEVGDLAIGKEKIWLSDQAWNTLEGIYKYDHNPFTSTRQASQAMSSDYGEENTFPLESFIDQEDVEILGKNYLTEKLDMKRKIRLIIVYAFTWIVPNKLLTTICRMQRPDIQTAWKEKITICILIALANMFVIFYMIFFGKILCPDYDRVWNALEVSCHQGSNDYYASISGKVYDFTKFYTIQHSDITNLPTTSSIMLEFAGQDLSGYFPKPLTVACPNLVTDESIWLITNQTLENPSAIHYTGSSRQQDNQDSALYQYSRYDNVFEPALQKYYIGDLVVSSSTIQSNANSQYNNWIVIDGAIYDLTSYFHTLNQLQLSSTSNSSFNFLNPDVINLIQANNGQDITHQFFDLDLKKSALTDNYNCLQQAFYAGKVDFRNSVKCQFTNYMLLIVAIILGGIVLIKFLSAFQFGQTQNPVLQDKFVVCHIPVYTEDEDEIRNALDSITCLQYPDDRKLLFIVCDGKVVGSGNDKPTPTILLNILGRGEELFRATAPTFSLKSVGEGSKKLNYGEVYSGLYDYEGHVVPYIVVVKVGSPIEVERPGNRGKRDSQILVMNFFNRVHFQSPMNPLELEIFHQINNIIGIDPECYEFLFMIDADTTVEATSLNSLVASCVSDKSIAG